MKKFSLLLALLFSVTILTGCGSSDKPSSSSGTSKPSTDTEVVKKPLSEEVTNRTKLDLSTDGSYEDKVFKTDGIGRATFLRHVDGDTTWFRDTGGNEFSFRYDGINTPESTKNVEPWGHQASAFTKEKLNKATEIVLQRDAAEFQTVGNRLMGLVWLKDAEHTDFYCLNLLIVEQAYSKNQMFDEKSKYLNAFIEAGNNAQSSGERVYGIKNDPNFDYSGKIREVTVDDIHANFDEFYTKTTKLRLTAVITRFTMGGFYVQSVEKDEVTGQKRSLYAYTMNNGFGSAVREGTILQFYCTAGEHNGSMQLVDVNVDDYEIFGQTTVENTLVDQNTDLTDPQLYHAPIEANLEVVKLGTEKPGKDVTLYCKFVGTNVEFNVRIPNQLIGLYRDYYKPGTKFKVNGCLDKFKFNENDTETHYQLKLCLEGLNKNFELI